MTKSDKKLIEKLTQASMDDALAHMNAMSLRWQNDHGISREHATFILAGAAVVVAGCAARAAYHSTPEETRFDAMKFLLMQFAESAGVDMLDIRKKDETFETVGTA